MRQQVFCCKAVLVAGLLIFAASCNQGVVDAPEIPEAPVGPAIQVSAAGADAAEPAIASDAEGNLYVVYVEHGGKQASDVFLQRYDNELMPDGPRVQISTDGAAKTWRGDPPTVVSAADGSLYVGWTRAVDSGGAADTDLLVSVSRDGGRTFAPPVKVNDDAKPASHGMHSLAVDNDGRVYAAWLDERNIKLPQHAENVGDTQFDGRPPGDYEIVKIHHTAGSTATPTPAVKAAAEAEPNSEVFFAVSSDGGRTFSANKKVAADVCPCCKTSLLAAGGNLYLSWRQVLPGDYRHIAVASSADQGTTFSQRTIVSDDKWKLNACPVSGAALADGDDGELRVFWYTAGDAGPAGLYMAASRDTGRTFGPRQMVGSADAVSGTPVAFSNSAECLYAADGSKIRLGTGSDAELDDASLPAAVMSNGRVVAAFVRTAGDKRSVWLSAIR